MNYLKKNNSLFFNHYSFQIGDGLFIGPETQEQLEEDVGFYLNHSCDPTAIIKNDNEWVARRDIEIDEEITADYSTFCLYITYFTNCSCGTKDCRGIIGEDDYKNHALIKKYWPHYYSHVKQAIQYEIQ